MGVEARLMPPHGGAIWPGELYLTQASSLGPRAPGVTGRKTVGSLPLVESSCLELDGAGHHGGPLAGRLPSRAKKVQRGALQELCVHLMVKHSLAKKLDYLCELH